MSIKKEVKTLKVTSEAFENGQLIPLKYTCDGLNVSPPMNIENIPAEAESLVIIMDDPDAPFGTFTHWLVWNIYPLKHIKENSIRGTEGINDFMEHNYSGPCPPSGTHNYRFKVYALGGMLSLGKNTRVSELEKAMSPQIIAFGELTGTYKRNP